MTHSLKCLPNFENVLSALMTSNLHFLLLFVLLIAQLRKSSLINVPGDYSYVFCKECHGFKVFE